jgi:hypothetical protein
MSSDVAPQTARAASHDLLLLHAKQSRWFPVKREQLSYASAVASYCKTANWGDLYRPLLGLI